ncbi:MAG: hypothetical protein H6585_10130 [Flavobacteriales bacterium]|nr:hypothetical protein [Flavobacteriales bacterium]
MIAGETEYLLGMSDSNQDYFFKKLFSGKNKQPKDPKLKEEKKQKRQQWWSKQKEGFQQAGGMEGVGKTIGNVVNLFKGTSQEPPSDYDVNMGHDESQDKKGVPKEVWIIGGIVVVLGVVYVVSKQMGKPKVIQQTANAA